MRSFDSLGAFATHLGAMVVIADHAKHEALDEASKIVLAEAQSLPGTYQQGWPALKPETIARKVTGDSPLLETGQMRDSYRRSVGHDEARVGSNDDRALWHELGTSKVPPRPVLLTAALQKETEVRRLLGGKTVAVLIQG